MLKTETSFLKQVLLKEKFILKIWALFKYFLDVEIMGLDDGLFPNENLFMKIIMIQEWQLASYQ